MTALSEPGPAAPSALKTLVRRAGLTRASGLYALVIVIVVFGFVLHPSVWYSQRNLSVVLSEASVVGVLAIAALIPMSAGMLDISFANVAGFALGLLAWLALHAGISTWLLAVITIAASSLYGLIAGLLVAWLSLPSLVVTLGTSSIALAVTQFLLGGQTLYPRARLAPSFLQLGSGQWGPVPVSTVLMLVLVVLAWAWLEHRPSGRRLLAVGGNAGAARLAGVRVVRYQVAALIASATAAGLGGVVLLATIGSADDVSGSAYLQPVIAAVFLGSTQLKPRFNVLGTLVAVILTETGLHGIQLNGNSQWVNYVFDALVLLVAVVVSRGSRKYAF